MTRYLMLTSAKGAADESGNTVTVYRQGETYTLPNAVADAFTAAGYCKAVTEEFPTVKVQQPESEALQLAEKTAAADPETESDPKPEAAKEPGPSETKPAKPSKKK